MTCRAFIVIVAVGMASSAIASSAIAAPPAPPPTMAEIQQLYTSGDNDGTLREIAHALSLGGKAGADYDKHALLELRGETHLRMKQPEPAAQAFHQAIKEAKDPKDAAVDKATEILIKKSKLLQYAPRPSGKGPASQPVSITDPEARKHAFDALYFDEWNALAPKLKAAMASRSLSVILDAAKEVNTRSVEELDLAAHGNDEATKSTYKDLQSHSADLMTKALEKLGKEVDDIGRRANEMIHQSQGPRGGDSAKPRGLSFADTRELKQVQQTAADIAKAAQELATDAGDKDSANDIVDKAKDVADRAQTTLTARYQ